MHQVFYIFSLFLFVFFTNANSVTAMAAEDKWEKIEVQDTRVVRLASENLLAIRGKANSRLIIKINGELDTLDFIGGTKILDWDFDRKGKIFALKNPGELNSLTLYHVSEKRGQIRVRKIPLWLTIVPPLLAIFMALYFKESVTALLAGIFAGAFIANGMYIDSLLISFMRTLDTYILGALNNIYHLSIILLTLLIGAMVAVISLNGGMQGVINKIKPYAKDRRSSKLTAYFMGLILFFDDYANTLIVGSSMKNLTDKFKVSREKLAYIVDSTAAPIAAIALITTWIGAELSYIRSGIIDIDIELGQSVYAIFLDSLKYSFYPILTIFFVFMIIWSRRDYGPMLKAEKRALELTGTEDENELKPEYNQEENLDPKPGVAQRWYNGVIPIFTMIFVAILALVHTGLEAFLQDSLPNAVFSWPNAWQATLQEAGPGSSFLERAGLIIGYSDPYVSLLWASGSAVVVALILTFGQKLLNLTESMKALGGGMKSMVPAITILVLAWALALNTQDLNTATYLAGLAEGRISPYLLPPIIFILAAFTAFSTGSSWSTMAILYPIAIPSTYAVCMAAGLDPEITTEILLNVISIVLAASVLGDHCSPLSDTTILSSLATGCDHIAHVRTQLPYALTVGIFSLFAAFFSTFLGGGWFVSLSIIIIGISVFWLIIKKTGRDPEAIEQT